MSNLEVYKPKNHIRFVTASSLFDGHDASINIMRRIIQASGAEVMLSDGTKAKEVEEKVGTYDVAEILEKAVIGEQQTLVS